MRGIAGNTQGRALVASGFTLLEALLTLVVLGILTSITLPSYQHVTRKVHRAAVQAQMLAIANREQQHLLARRTYTAALSELGYVLPADVAARYSCRVSVDNSGVPRYEIRCTPQAIQDAAGFSTLVLTETGSRAPAEEW